MLLRRFACCLLGLLLFGSPSLAARDDTETKPVLTDAEKKLHLESFDMVWQTVRDKHFDPKLGGLDWEAVRTELRPKVEKAKTTAEVRAILRDMLGRLKQSHFGILSSDSYEALQGEGSKKPPRSAGSAEPGMEVRILDGQATVTRVRKDGPAEKAGVKPGWIVLKIDEVAIPPILEKVRKAQTTTSTLDLYLSRSVTDRMHGNAGDVVPVLFKDGADKEVAVKITLAEPPGQAVQFGHLPTFYVTFESHKLPDNICYLRWNAFFAPDLTVAGVRKVVTENRDATGMILDLRGNPGGIGIMAVGIGSCFVQKEDQRLGTMKTRTNEMRFILNPGPRSYTGPLAILVDGCSASTTEIFAGGMQDIKRAKIFGTRTAGAALPANIVRLPNGDGFIYAIANYTSSGGQVLEGRGVIPDVEAQPTRQALLAGHDPALEAAVVWIKSQAGEKK
jgi:carboxyl-terminal processing protease